MREPFKDEHPAIQDAELEDLLRRAEREQKLQKEIEPDVPRLQEQRSEARHPPKE
jgi:hypothetical protein